MLVRVLQVGFGLATLAAGGVLARELWKRRPRRLRYDRANHRGILYALGYTQMSMKDGVLNNPIPAEVIAQFQRDWNARHKAAAFTQDRWSGPILEIGELEVDGSLERNDEDALLAAQAWQVQTLQPWNDNTP